MKKLLFRFFLLIFIVGGLALTFFSYFGLETDKFNTLIKNKANESHQQVKLEFENTKIYLNLGELNLAVKLQKPIIMIKNKEIVLSTLNLYLPLRSFITSDFLLEKAQSYEFFSNFLIFSEKMTGPRSRQPAPDQPGSQTRFVELFSRQTAGPVAGTRPAWQLVLDTPDGATW